jgi:hypothetical protein
MPSVSSIECPLCSRCRTRMVLIKMELRPQGAEKRMFECSKCHFIETKIVEFKSDAQGGASFGQVKMPSLLALHAGDRAIGGFSVGLSVQRHAEGEPSRCVVSNDLDAAYRFTPRPLANGFEALLSKRPIAHSNCSWIRHESKQATESTAPPKRNMFAWRRWSVPGPLKSPRQKVCRGRIL